MTDHDARRRQPARKTSKAGAAAAQQPKTGTPATGTIVKLMFGQGHGYIRLSTDRRDVYFHRGDVAEGTPFNEFAIGDKLAFELLEDKFSGPRALAVRRAR